MKATQDLIRALRSRSVEFLKAADMLTKVDHLMRLSANGSTRPKRHLSAAGRRAIQKAQRTRWAKIKAGRKAAKRGA